MCVVVYVCVVCVCSVCEGIGVCVCGGRVLCALLKERKLQRLNTSSQVYKIMPRSPIFKGIPERGTKGKYNGLHC